LSVEEEPEDEVDLEKRRKYVHKFYGHVSLIGIKAYNYTLADPLQKKSLN